METIQNSPYSNPSKNSRRQGANRTVNPPAPETSHNEVFDLHPAHKYSKKANAARVKRAARENPNKRKSCSLYIQTDPLFWRHIREQVRKKMDRISHDWPAAVHCTSRIGSPDNSSIQKVIWF